MNSTWLITSKLANQIHEKHYSLVWYILNMNIHQVFVIGFNHSSTSGLRDRGSSCFTWLTLIIPCLQECGTALAVALSTPRVISAVENSHCQGGSKKSFQPCPMRKITTLLSLSEEQCCFIWMKLLYNFLRVFAMSHWLLWEQYSAFTRPFKTQFF